jgi:hypothetical protein
MKKETNNQDKNPNLIEIHCKEEDSTEKIVAQTYLKPSVLAAKSIKDYYKDADQMNINALIEELLVQTKDVNNGDLHRPEAMLIAQAHTLDSLFHEMIKRFRLTSDKNFLVSEKYMRLALKAQSQCRTTLEALAEIKNPKPYIQNNKAQYQQVNNGITEPRAHEKKLKTPNELLEDKTHEQEWLDTGTPETTSRNDKKLETLEAQHGRKD